MRGEREARTGVLQQCLDQIDVGEHHSAAAVALQAEFVQRRAKRVKVFTNELRSIHVFILEIVEIGFPLVAHDLWMREYRSLNTFPQVKQRTGIIIAGMGEGNGDWIGETWGGMWGALGSIVSPKQRKRRR